MAWKEYDGKRHRNGGKFIRISETPNGGYRASLSSELMRSEGINGARAVTLMYDSDGREVIGFRFGENGETTLAIAARTNAVNLTSFCRQFGIKPTVQRYPVVFEGEVAVLDLEYEEA